MPPVSKKYGNTVGPLLRSSGVSNNWRTWVVDVVSKKADRAVVTIKNDFDQARCTGRSSTTDGKTGMHARAVVGRSASTCSNVPPSGPSRPAKGTDRKCFNIVSRDRNRSGARGT